MGGILPRPDVVSPPALLSLEVSVDDGDVLDEPVLPAPAQSRRVTREPQAQLSLGLLMDELELLLYSLRRSYQIQEAVMFRLGVPELIMIALLVLFMFGGKKLPEMGKGIGEGIKNFKKSIKGDEADTKSTPNT